MKVFKFGGASVKDAAGVRNVAKVLSHFPDDDLLIVLSAMGKTTNALEEVMWAYREGRNTASMIDKLHEQHQAVLDEVAPGSDITLVLRRWFNDLRGVVSEPVVNALDQDYDRIVAYGEFWSTFIVVAHLKSIGLPAFWQSARDVVATDDLHRSARVNWDVSATNTKVELGRWLGEAKPVRIITQGFIGKSSTGHTTTLGREGSDFSAAIFAYLLDAESVTIWKDVPGMFNADPKKFPDTKLLKHISYKEAIELSYFGASVIHPRTLQPLQRKNIPLYVRSFMDLDANGSTISEATDHDTLIPSFIHKPGQVLLSITPRDLSFVVEENLSGIFSTFSKHGVRVNMMQNSAVAFTVCVDNDNRVKPLVMELRGDYEVKWNEDLELLTVRHPDEATLTKLTHDREILLEQRSRTTARFVLK